MQSPFDAKTLAAFLTGLGLGATVMYLLDPQGGNRRRSLAKDKAKHLSKRTRENLVATGKDLAHRARGLAHETRKSLKNERVRGPKLEERVRAELGHHVSDLSSVNVIARQGEVTLTGSLPSGEIEDALEAVSSVHGVRQVRNRLNLN